MVSCALTTLWLAASLGQAPAAATAAPSPEASWLKVAPAEADVVLRVRSVQGARDDLGKMARAMSPTLAPQAQAMLDQGLAMFSGQFGKNAAALPFMVMIRMPKDGANGPPPYAVIVGAKDYAAVQKQVVGPAGNAKPKPQPGGYDQVSGPNNEPIYTFKGANFVAYGTSSDLVGAIAKPKGSLDAKLAPEVRSRFLAGDLGVYVNLASVQARYGEQIQDFRKTQMAKLDEAAAKEGPQAQGAEQGKAILNRLIDSLKDGDSMAMNIDFAAEGLTVDGFTAVKADSAAAKKLATSRAGAGENLAVLPGDAAFYIYTNVDPQSFEQLQKLSLAFSSKSGKPSPALQKAMAMQREAGASDSTGAVSFGKDGVRSISLVTFANPKKAADAGESAAAAMADDKAELPDVVKDVKFEAEAQKYKEFRFSSTKITFDKEKLAKLAPDAKGAGKGVLGESMTTWNGTDGKHFLSVTAPDWDAAKEQIDTVLNKTGGIGQVAGYKAIREMLPKQVGSIFLISAQSLLKQGLAQLALAQPDNAAAKADLDLPKSPELFGGAVTPTARGILFKFVLPSTVGPVVEQGIMPLLGGGGDKVQQ